MRPTKLSAKRLGVNFPDSALAFTAKILEEQSISSG